jgi:hypothetical protein
LEASDSLDKMKIKYQLGIKKMGMASADRGALGSRLAPSSVLLKYTSGMGDERSGPLEKTKFGHTLCFAFYSDYKARPLRRLYNASEKRRDRSR